MNQQQVKLRAAQILEQLTIELKKGRFWLNEGDEGVPSATARASLFPFCADTMGFPQWLQFIFIPKISELISAEAALHCTSSIAPMAELSFLTLAPNSQAIVDREPDPLKHAKLAMVVLLKEFDGLFTAQPDDGIPISDQAG